MTFDERLAAIRANMSERRLDALVAVHDGAHFIETPNPVFVLSHFKSLGPAAVVLRRDGETSLIVTPAWDTDRAAECCTGTRIVSAEDVVDGIATTVGGQTANIGIAGLAFTRSEIASRVAEMLPEAKPADDIVFDDAAC